MAVAAHGSAGGGLPTATGLYLLLGLAVSLSVVAATVPRLREGRPALLALLVTGQVAGHEVIGLDAHHQGATSAQMLLAHALAVLVCVQVIALVERLAPASVAALQRIVLVLPPLLPRARVPRVLPQGVAPAPLFSALLDVSVPRRGPPVRA